MTAALQSLAGDVCDIAGVPCPGLTLDAHGTQSFSLLIDDIHVNVMQFPASAADDESTPVLMAELGPIADLPMSLTWTMLLAANEAAAGADLPRFGRGPQSAEVMLLWPSPPQDLSPLALYGRIRGMVDIARACRSNSSPAEALMALAAQRAPSTPASQRMDGGLAIERSGVTVKVRKDFSGDHGASHITVDLEKLIPTLDAEIAASLMEANYLLALKPNGPMLYHEDASNSVALAFAEPTARLDTANLLRRVEHFVAQARQWLPPVARA